MLIKLNLVVFSHKIAYELIGREMFAWPGANGENIETQIFYSYELKAILMSPLSSHEHEQN